MPAHEADDTWKKHPILLVDDEPEVLRTLRRILDFEDFNCKTAPSGEEALAMLESYPAKVVISDHNMNPGMNGSEFLSKVRDRFPHTVTMILSAHSEPGIILDAVNQAGAYQYLLKPYHQEDLLLRVSQALRYYHSQAEVRRIAEAKRRMLRRMSHLENVSLVGAFSATLHDRFQEVVRELLWSATRKVESSQTPYEAMQADSEREDRLYLATILSRIGKLGQYYNQAMPFRQRSAFEAARNIMAEAEQHAARGSEKIAWLTEFSNCAEGEDTLLLQDLSFDIALRALIENAVLHNRKRRDGRPKQVHLRGLIEEAEGERVLCIEIADDGPGVPESKADEIFAPLVSTAMQGVTDQSKLPPLGEFNFEVFGHVGLGLALARWSVTSHDGELELVNPGEEGARFRITIPLAQEDLRFRLGQQ